MRLIFCIAPPKGQLTVEWIGSPIFLAYVEQLDVVPQAESLNSTRRMAGPDPLIT